jgi:hypothetical protein
VALFRHGVLSLTSWFQHPSINQQYEVLCRGSVTCLDESKKDTLSLIASHHVCSPFRFPQHYDQPFLSSLSEEHVRFSIEVRDMNGSILSQIRLDPTRATVFGHKIRDIASLPLHRLEFDTLRKGAASSNVNIQPVKLVSSSSSSSSSSKQAVYEGLELDFIGHFLSPSIDPNTGEDISLLIPKKIPGRVKLCTRQTFATTSEILEMGFCGGAVLKRREGKNDSSDSSSSSSSSDSNSVGVGNDNDESTLECVGVVEGIVPIANNTTSKSELNTTDNLGSINPKDQAKKLLAGCAVFVEANEIREILR